MGVGVGFVVLVWMAVLCVYDVRQRRLPNSLTLPGAAAVLLFAALTGRGLPSLAGALALGLLYAVIYATGEMGGGDVKLAVGVGGISGYFGVDVWLLAAIGAPLLTAVWALVALACRGARRVPHGPSMCVATAVAATLAIV